MLNDFQEYDRKLEEMQQQYEEEKVSKSKLEQDMLRLRSFYDNRISNLDGQIEKLPTTAEGNSSFLKMFQTQSYVFISQAVKTIFVLLSVFLWIL